MSDMSFRDQAVRPSTQPTNRQHDLSSALSVDSLIMPNIRQQAQQSLGVSSQAHTRQPVDNLIDVADQFMNSPALRERFVRDADKGVNSIHTVIGDLKSSGPSTGAEVNRKIDQLDRTLERMQNIDSTSGPRLAAPPAGTFQTQVMPSHTPDEARQKLLTFQDAYTKYQSAPEFSLTSPSTWGAKQLAEMQVKNSWEEFRSYYDEARRGSL